MSPWSPLQRQAARPGRPSGWRGLVGGKRVLVEHPDRRVREALAQGLRDHGYQVSECPGPSNDPTVCPLLHGDRCHALDGADAVVTGLQGDHASIVELVEASDPRRPVLTDPPRRVSGSMGQHRLYRTTIGPLVRRLNDALASRPEDVAER